MGGGEYYAILFRCVKYKTLSWFQYKILQRILTTNTFLYMIHHVDSIPCEFCKTSCESLQHLFFDCNKVNQFWEKIRQWIWTETGINIHFSKDIVMFGMINNAKRNVINWFIINIKYYICTKKIQKKSLNINEVKHTLKNKFEIERFILYKNCNYEVFKKQWTPWFNLFI